MERTFVPKNRIKINIALAYLLSGTQGVEPRQLKDQIGVYHVLSKFGEKTPASKQSVSGG